jgi:dipeptidase E
MPTFPGRTARRSFAVAGRHRVSAGDGLDYRRAEGTRNSQPADSSLDVPSIKLSNYDGFQPGSGSAGTSTFGARFLEALVKLLLTSGGVRNPSIHSALLELLGKPISECNALCIPTAQWGHPMCSPTSVRNLLVPVPDFRFLTGLGWGSLGVLELTALPTIGAKRWVPWVQEADVLLVDGGDATYLCHWIRESGLADLLPTLPDLVWVGVSAGSMVMTPRIGSYFVEWPSAPDDRTLGVVDFSIFPHLNLFPTNTPADAERWAADIAGPAYAIDEETAFKVVDGSVEVISEGEWTKFG